ncbi:hypothetical protein [Blastococcus sp. CCUG 61487]|uniref:hypothetical protein n=1 Tax=Blastococcus sp. CCUG 61487 TaxID=1840703 RepID=UPI0010C03826|nr:hypothetical protein [Blastococcus sp. CCUG 61487]TKJ18785.1 hypothetical protein A6V29_10940 [Blastococcus sp. CCUG 61487]
MDPAVEDDGAGTRAGLLARRRVLLVALGAVLLVAAVVLAVVLATGGDEPDDAGAGTAATAGATPSATEEPAPPSEEAPDPAAPVDPGTPAPADPDAEVPALPAVALDQSVAVDEVTASITLIEEIDGTATGPGDVAGPALRITVRIVNETDADVPLDGISVNAFHGEERTPAPPLGDPSRSPFAGVLAPTDTAEGVYVFRVPVDRRHLVTVEVGYKAGAPLAVFSGRVG